MLPRTTHAHASEFPHSRASRSSQAEFSVGHSDEAKQYLGRARMNPRWRVPGRWWTRRPRPGTPTSPSRTRTPWGTTRGSTRPASWRPSPPRRRHGHRRRRRWRPAARAAPPTERPSRLRAHARRPAARLSTAAVAARSSLTHTPHRRHRVSAAQ